MALSILPSNLFLKQNIDHSQYLVREIFNSQIVLLYKYSIISLGKQVVYKITKTNDHG